MNRPSASLLGAFALALAVACGSAEEESTAAAQVADLSQFPTPTRSQAAVQDDVQQVSQATDGQPQGDEDEGQNANASSEVAPMTQEELQQLRELLQSDQLSEEERARVVQRLRTQFGGGQGGSGFGGGGSQAVGTIQSVRNNTITVATELATVTANVGNDTNVRITSLLEPSALAGGVQVMVVSERVEGATLARAITVVPESQAEFGRGRGGPSGQAGFGAGQGGGGNRPLFGTIGTVDGDGFTLETQQGPLPIVVNEETVIIRTRQGTVSDLEPGMRVRVAGPADENGAIDARSVNVTPEGLEDIRGFGGGGGRGGDRGVPVGGGGT